MRPKGYARQQKNRYTIGFIQNSKRDHDFGEDNIEVLFEDALELWKLLKTVTPTPSKNHNSGTLFLGCGSYREPQTKI